MAQAAATAGCAVGGRDAVRFGRGERHQVFVDLQNLGDTNYRGISWGVDAAGRGIDVGFTERVERTGRRSATTVSQAILSPERGPAERSRTRP